MEGGEATGQADNGMAIPAGGGGPLESSPRQEGLPEAVDEGSFVNEGTPK